MKITLVNSGTRGDAQPLVVVGHELARRGHEVRVGLPPNVAALGTAAGLETLPFGPDTRELLESEQGRRWLAAGNVRSFMKELTAISRAHIERTISQMHRLADGSDLIVAGLLAEDLALPSAEALGVPFASLHSAPYRRTRDLPMFMVTTRPLGPLNRSTGALFDRVWWQGVSEQVAAFRAQLGLPVDRTPTATKLHRATLLELQAYSSVLVPAPADYGPSRPLVGLPVPGASLREAWGDAGVDGDLDRWLADGEPPVYFGLGSMPLTDPEATVRMVGAVTQALGVRALVSVGASRLRQRPPAESLFVAGPLDHDTVFPRCRVLVHHGGAGTTAAAVQAGRPSVVCSVFADQPFWGRRLQQLGVGLAVPFARLDAPRLESALRQVTAPAYAAAAERLGAELRSQPRAEIGIADRLEALLAGVRS